MCDAYDILWKRNFLRFQSYVEQKITRDSYDHVVWSRKATRMCDSYGVVRRRNYVQFLRYFEEKKVCAMPKISCGKVRFGRCFDQKNSGTANFLDGSCRNC